MRNKSLLRYLLCLIMSFSLHAEETEPILLEWEDIHSASGYKIEIKNSKNNTIFDKETNETKIELKLTPGKYKKRLTIYNKLGEIETKTKWLPLNILREKGIRVKVKWKEIPLAKQYLLEIKDKNGNLVKKKKVKSNSIWLTLEPGNYKRRLSAINKLGEVESKTKWLPFNVILVQSPEINQPIKRHTGIRGDKAKEIVIKGKNFEKETSIELEQNGYKIPIIKKVVEDQNSLQVALNLSESPIGKYRLSLHNKRGKKLVVPSFLNVKEPKVVKPKETENWEIVMRSLAFPGWGELFAGKKYTNSSYRNRGIVYSSVFVTALLYNINLRQNFQKYNTKVAKTFKQGSTSMVLTSEDDEGGRTAIALATTSRLQTQKNKMAAISSQSNNATQFLVGIYLIQLMDALFINRNVNKIIPNKTGLNISIEKTTFSPFRESRYDMYYEFEF